jgi:hypothetical protein
MEDNSMKKLMLAALVCTFLFSSVALRAAEEVDGFRGMNWGTPIAEITKMKHLVMKQDDGRDNYVFYSIVNDDLRFAGVHASRIRYFFWRDKLAGVVIATEGVQDLKALKLASDQEFGLGITGIGPSGEEINTWNGETTVATLSYEQATGKGQLVLLSKKIHELKEGIE